MSVENKLDFSTVKQLMKWYGSRKFVDRYGSYTIFEVFYIVFVFYDGLLNTIIFPNKCRATFSSAVEFEDEILRWKYDLLVNHGIFFDMYKEDDMIRLEKR